MGKGKEGDGKGEERKGKGRRERADPRPGLRNVKVATLKCGGPTTMPEEHRGPWSKKFENRSIMTFILLSLPQICYILYVVLLKIHAITS